MPPREWKLRVTDILEAARKIQAYTAGRTYADFCADEQLVDAVLRRFQVIGEAARNVPEEVMARHRHVAWDDMRAMRNVVIHVYFGIALDIVWQTIQDDLPVLIEHLSELLAAEA